MVNVFLAQMINVDHLPPAARNAVCKVSNSLDDIAKYTADIMRRDMAAYEAYRAWFQEHPLPPERGPAGRTDFKFYLLAEVAEATR